MGRIPPPVRKKVLARDRRCVASYFWPHVCAWGDSIHPPDDWSMLELDHIREESTMGKEPKSVPEHLVALCRYAHQQSGWATRNRELLRAYLEVVLGGVVPTRRNLRHLLPLMR